MMTKTKMIYAVLGLALLLAGPVRAWAEDPPGEPVAYLLLADPNLFPDLQKAGPANAYVAGYKGVAILDRNLEHPMLVTHGFNLKLNKLVKVYVNFDRLVGVQILDPSIAF